MKPGTSATCEPEVMPPRERAGVGDVGALVTKAQAQLELLGELPGARLAPRMRPSRRSPARRTRRRAPPAAAGYSTRCRRPPPVIRPVSGSCVLMPARRSRACPSGCAGDRSTDRLGSAQPGKLACAPPARIPWTRRHRPWRIGHLPGERHLRIEAGLAVGLRVARLRAAVQETVRGVIGRLIQPVPATAERQCPPRRELLVDLAEDRLVLLGARIGLGPDLARRGRGIARTPVCTAAASG